MGGRIAVGFDVGETLLTYAGIPPSWVDHYGAALASVATACELDPSAACIAGSSEILTRHNTRINPRRHEIPADIIFREILWGWSVDPDPHLERAIAAFFAFFQQRLLAYPETLDVLEALKGRGIPLGVLTDVPYGMPRDFVQRDLVGAHAHAFFNVVLTSVDVGWRKPEAIGFKQLARQLGCSADEMWYVGNEQKDIAGASTAGSVAILIDRDGRQPAWGQRHTIRSLRELVALL